MDIDSGHDPARPGSLLVYYGGSSPGFAAFLKNLGLRRSDGTPKEAWAAWQGLP